MKILTKTPSTTLIEPNLLGDAEKRLDAFYYCNLKFLPEIKSKLVFLKEVCNINPKRRIGSLPYNAIVPYIGLPDTDEHTGTVINIERRSYEQVKGRNIVLKNDILFARIEPSIYNQKYIYVDKLPEKQKYAFTSTEFHVLESKKGIDPRYIFWMIKTDFVYNQIFGKVKGTTGRRRLDKLELEGLEIPFLPPEIRGKIVEIMENVYKTKIYKLTKSKELIEEINKFVFDELSIKLQITENKKTYLVELEGDSEKRVDPFFYHPKYLNLLNTIENSPYEVGALREISKSIVSGQRPKGGVKYIKEGVPSIGGEHITSEGDFNFKNIRYIPNKFHENKKKSWIKPFDILIVKDGATTGKVAIVPKDFPFKECNINEHVFKIEVEDNYNPYYLFSYLFSSLGQEQINRLISGAAQKGITRDAIEPISVISPPREIQKNIAEEVKRRMKESGILKKEAEEVAKKAKKEVEKMIVGET